MKSMMNVKGGLRVLALAVGTCLVGASAVADSLWIGGASGNWNDVNNWSGGTVPNGADAVARIESTSDVTISVGSGTYTVGAIYASGGNHKILGSGYINLNASSGTGVVDVAENALLTTGCRLDASVAQGTALAKTGLGTFETTNQVGRARALNGVDVRQGTFNLNGPRDSDAVRPGGLFVVRTGAKAKLLVRNLLWNDTIIHTESGGIFDANGFADLIGALTGEGIVTNASAGISMTLYNGPYTFFGRVFGKVLVEWKSNGQWYFNCPAENRLWVVGTRDALADASFLFNSQNPGDRLISFAPGAGGEFVIKELGYRYGQPLVLTDTDGNPVTVLTTPDPTARATGRVTGEGSLTALGWGSYSATFTNDMMTAKGTYALTSGTNTFGNGVAEKDAVVTSLAAVDMQRWATLVRRNATNETWDTTELIGMGTVVQDAPSDWSLPLSMTGGTFRVTSRAGANEVTFSGGNSTNVTLDLNSAPTARIAFTGGTHHFMYLTGSNTRTYRQTDGVVYAGPVSGHYSAASQSDIFYTMTGGKLYSTTYNSHSRGLGLDMSGDSEAHLRWAGTTWFCHRLASDGESHTIRLRDNAYLTVDRMDLGTPSSNVQTPTFDLQGGMLEVSEWLTVPNFSEANYPNYTGSFILNGGWIRSTAQPAAYGQWCTWNFFNKFTGYVGVNGAHFDVPHKRWGRHFRVIMPILTGVANGMDGGLEKTGMGYFVFENAATYTGPTCVRGGVLRTTAYQANEAPYGTGSVFLENGMLLTTRAVNHTMASAPGATVTYRGGSILGSLEPNADQLLTIGPADAAQDAVLVRDGHGVLALMVRNVANLTLGGSWKFKVNGGLSLDANTGLVTAPVFGYFAGSAGGWWYVTFLTYDDEVGFKEPTYVEGLGGGNTSVARISSAKVTLTANAHVGALDMRLAAGPGGLSIADGKTLTVGNGAGTRAMVLMNSCNHTASQANRYQTITGNGAIDFGAAEGLVVCNQSCRDYYVYLAGQINCPIRGTGGMTFAGLAEHTGHSDLQLGAANTYTGGTWIENLCVKPMVNGAFSSGTVTVDGSMATGGGIWIPSNSAMTTLPNALTLSGNGRFTDLGDDKNLLETFGALRADRTVNVTGAVSLPTDTRISSFRSATRLTLSGGVSGAGKLFVSGSGTVVLPSANSYTGGTTVEGVLEVQNAAALGTGPVKVTADGTLRFANTSPLTIANAITGEGTIEFAGSAPVTLSAADGFAGTRRATGGVTAAGYDLVKEGDDTMTLTAANTYGGETRVLGGTLALGPQPAETLPCPEAISLRLDADDASSRTMNGNNVVAWADADGRGITFTNSATATSPVLNEGTINGKDTLFFGGLLHRMVSDKGVAARTIFIVNKFPPKSTPHPKTALGKSGGWDYAGIMGDVGVDCGIRVLSNGTWIQNDWTDSADIYCNGQKTVNFNWDTPQISTFALTRTHDSNARIVVGDYWCSTAHYRSYYGDIAEVLVYDRHLEDAERQAVESYLGEKWGIAVAAPAGVATNVLPTATDVTVADGATLDLAGRVQTVASLAGAGLVTNSSPTQATLAPGDLSGFNGTLTGNVRLEITGTTTLSANATIDPGIDLHLAPGAILDLNGRTITVRNASGSGFVRNGTLIVTGQDNRRNPATMIIFR